MNLIPLWNPYLPAGAKPLPPLNPAPEQCTGRKGPLRRERSCICLLVSLESWVRRLPTRNKRPSRNDSSVLMDKAGVEVIYPEQATEQCCGIMFHSRGCVDASDAAMAKLEGKLLKASENGKYPIVCDTSPCLKHVKDHVRDPLLKFALYEPEFVATFLGNRLEFEKKKESVAIHVPCSSKR